MCELKKQPPKMETNESPSQTNHPTAVKVELFSKITPILALLIYVFGYLIRLAYFRSINVHCIDFFKPECFETGAAFCVVSLAVIAFVSLPVLVILLWKNKSSLISPHITLLGTIMSVLAVMIAWVTMIVVAFFLRPQDIIDAHIHLGQMVSVCVIFIIILLGLTVLQNKCVGAEELNKPMRIKSKKISNLADVFRAVFFGLVVYYSYSIFFRDLSRPVYIFDDQYCLGYLLFLGLFLAITWRLFSTKPAVKNSDSGKIDNGGKKENSKVNAVQSSLQVILRVSFSVIFLFLLIICFAFGPFIHIPTSKGGGRQYSEVKIVFSDAKTASLYPFSVIGSNVTSSIILLAENNSWVYVTTNNAVDPRRAFRAVARGSTFCIDKHKISGMRFEKIP